MKCTIYIDEMVKIRHLVEVETDNPDNVGMVLNALDVES